MRRVCLVLGVLVLLPMWSRVAHAGTYSAALSRCLIHATTPADRKVVLRWAFATMALDPDVAPLATITPAQREAINQRTGAVLTNLLANACARQVQATLMFEGTQGAQAAFEGWGRWAITGLVTQPAVAGGMTTLLQYVDIAKLMSLVPLQGLSPTGSR